MIPAVITVGATMTQNTRRRGSMMRWPATVPKGPTAIDHIVKPDLVAPGNRMVSLRAAGSTLDVNLSAI